MTERYVATNTDLDLMSKKKKTQTSTVDIKPVPQKMITRT